MIQVSYISRSSHPMSAAELLSILMSSRENNQASGITGMLLYGNGTFLQVIEGEDAVIDRLVERLGRDSRHTDVRILSRRTVPERQYADWSMGFERVSDQGLEAVEGLRGAGATSFDFDELVRNEAAVERIIDHFRAPHWDPLVRELDARDRLIAHLRRGLQESRSRSEVAALVLESVIDAARERPLSAEHLRLCESTLASLRSR
jgi:hypothetical protein